MQLNFKRKKFTPNFLIYTKFTPMFSTGGTDKFLNRFFKLTLDFV